MMKNLKLCLLLVTLLSLPACLEEEFPTGIVPENGLAPVVIQPPCTYDDWVEVESLPGMTDELFRIERYWSTDYDEVTLRFYSSSNTVRIRYRKNHGFPNIQSQVVDFGAGPYKGVEMDVDFSSSSLSSMEAVSGQLYIVKQADGSIKFDWCNVKFYNEDFGVYHKSKGGCLLKF